jgi:ABC-type bacteriocin/lantibiotic exporter with double-glycine peptidase domain
MRKSYKHFVLAGILASGLCLGSDSIGHDSVWVDVPFFKQEKNLCGAACITMIMEYWRSHQGNLDKMGKTPAMPTPQEVRSAFEIRRANGVYGSQIAVYLESHGFRTFVFKGAWSDLEDHLSKGRPLMIALGGRGSNGPNHYVVLTGLDSSNKTVLINDPARRKLSKMDQADFLESWRKTFNWTLLALPESHS